MSSLQQVPHITFLLQSTNMQTSCGNAGNALTVRDRLKYHDAPLLHMDFTAYN